MPIWLLLQSHSEYWCGSRHNLARSNLRLSYVSSILRICFLSFPFSLEHSTWVLKVYIGKPICYFFKDTSVQELFLQNGDYFWFSLQTLANIRPSGSFERIEIPQKWRFHPDNVCSRGTRKNKEKSQTRHALTRISLKKIKPSLEAHPSEFSQNES